MGKQINVFTGMVGYTHKKPVLDINKKWDFDYYKSIVSRGE